MEHTNYPAHDDPANYQLTGEIRRMVTPLANLIPTQCPTTYGKATKAVDALHAALFDAPAEVSHGGR